MLRRLFWFAVGLGLGVGLSVRLARVTRRTAERYTPEGIAGRVADGLSDLGRELRAAVEDGRRAMAEREAQLRSDLETPSVGSVAGDGHGGGPRPRGPAR